MVVVVLAPEVVDVTRADQRPAQLARDPHDPLVALVLFGEPVLLHLEVHAVGAERLHELVGVRASKVGRSASRCWQKREARQPLSAITPSA